MGFSFMSINKLGSKTKLIESYLHNFRCYNVENADPAKINDNKEYLLTPGKTYLDCFDEKINQQQLRGIKQPIRKDAVRALEIVATYTKDATTANIDVDKWVNDNIEWMNKTFNTDKTNNLISCMLHCDEPGNFHIHAIIIPMDDKGRLNASYYLDGGPQRFRELQSSYGQMMLERHGLERGVQKSVAKHSTVKRYLSRLNNPVGNELPELFTGESAKDYFKRIQPIAEDSRLYHKRLELEYTTKFNQLSGNATQIPKLNFYTMLNGAVNLESWKPRNGENAIAYRNRVNLLYENEMLMCQNRIIKLKNQIESLDNPELKTQVEIAEKDAELTRIQNLVKNFSASGDLEEAHKKLKQYIHLERSLSECKDEQLIKDVKDAISKLENQYDKEQRKMTRSTKEKQR